VRTKGRLVVLNKIDGLWDGLRAEDEIDAEIARQVHSCAQILEIHSSHVFPVSAQKALVAKVNHDSTLLDRSRVANLEAALSADLIPAKQQIVAESIQGDALDIVQRTRELLDSRMAGIFEQLRELQELRGKNQSVIQYMMLKVKTEKDDFERGLQQYYAVRSVFSSLTNKLFDHLGMDTVREQTRLTREAMLSANFTRGLREAMTNFFGAMHESLDASSAEIQEITTMLSAMYKRFTVQHGLKLGAPTPFSVLRYQKDLERLEQGFNTQFNTMVNFMTKEKRALTQKFFETIAVQVRRTFEVANRDIEHWLRAIMAPLETQVREYQLQLKRRLESVKRIHHATDTLQERISELTQMESALTVQIRELITIEGSLVKALRCGNADLIAQAA
jgi:hypothetical protein